jgi:hypothetical protein
METVLVAKAEDPFKTQEERMTHTPENPGLDGRAREANGQIERKHPTTKIKHLREHYGAHFANGWDGEKTLGELLEANNCASLTQYVRNFRHHPLEKP